MAPNEGHDQGERTPDTYAQGQATAEIMQERRFSLRFSLYMRGTLSLIIVALFSCLIGHIVIVQFDDNLLRTIGSLFALPLGMILGYWFGVWTQRF